MLRQGPDSKARRAAATAASISARSPSATWASTSPVAGLKTLNVFPLFESTNAPLMKSFLSCFKYAFAKAGSSGEIGGSRSAIVRVLT